MITAMPRVTSFALVLDCQPAPDPNRAADRTADQAANELHRIAADVNRKAAGATPGVNGYIDGGHLLIVHGVGGDQEAVLRDLIIRVLSEGGRVLRVSELPTSPPTHPAHQVAARLTRMLAEARLIESA